MVFLCATPPRATALVDAERVDSFVFSFKQSLQAACIPFPIESEILSSPFPPLRWCFHIGGCRIPRFSDPTYGALEIFGFLKIHSRSSTVVLLCNGGHSQFVTYVCHRPSLQVCVCYHVTCFRRFDLLRTGRCSIEGGTRSFQVQRRQECRDIWGYLPSVPFP